MRDYLTSSSCWATRRSSLAFAKYSPAFHRARRRLGELRTGDTGNRDSRSIRITRRYFVIEVRRCWKTPCDPGASDVPVGTYLSGGMDSSIVTRLAAAREPGRSSITGVFRDGAESRVTVRAGRGGRMRSRPRDRPDGGRLRGSASAPILTWMNRSRFQFAAAVRRRQSGGSQVKVCWVARWRRDLRRLRSLCRRVPRAGAQRALFETNEELEHIVSLTVVLPNLPISGATCPCCASSAQRGVRADG